MTSTERRASREGALASLEGRGEDDFMDMGDDEYDDQVATAVEEDDIVIVSTPPYTSSARVRTRRSTLMESWFPLASFIDLRDDDAASWNWRNFIELGGAS